MEFFRKQLTANKEEIYTVNSQFVTIMNIGEGDVYISFDEVATVNSLLIPGGFGRNFYFPSTIKDVHVISEGTPLVQIDKMR